VQQFNEVEGGQVVFHLHFHVMPRFAGIALKPPAGPMESPEVLAENAARIKAALEKS
jgi:histidine triad (HIT) family protein